MAKGDKSNRTCKIGLRQEIATDTYATQTLNNFNPSITDDKAYYFADKLNKLTEKSLDTVIRTDKYNIAYE